jgi:hypothetical protein
MMGSAYAQSNLPACQGVDPAKWNNCYGTHVYQVKRSPPLFLLMQLNEVLESGAGNYFFLE